MLQILATVLGEFSFYLKVYLVIHKMVSLAASYEWYTIVKILNSDKLSI